MIRRLLPALLLLTANLAHAQLPAFPGAEGFGAYATGGRNGDVYTVTNLNSSGAGSLREGIESAPSAGRTIVFAVSGYIHVPGSNLRIVKNNITIAGQTAPGDGIGLRDGTVRITGNNTQLRHLRLRHGKNGGGGDCLNVDSSATDSIVDHVTMQFSTDENISFFNSTLDRFTMQHSVSAWGLESHNAGGLWDLDHGSCHHSLWAHHHTRNPKARPYGLLEWVNNVTFDWGIGFIMGDSQTPAPWKANVVGSYFLSPPGRTDNTALEKATVDRNGNPNFSLYLADCLHDSDGDTLLDGTDKGYSIVAGSVFRAGDPPGANRYARSNTPFPGSTGRAAITTHDPLTAFKIVLSDAGALRLDATLTKPLRDEVDTLLFDNLDRQRTSRISRESDLAVSNNGFGTLESGTAPTDLDLDGMPDFWEQALGSNPARADHNTVFPSTSNTFFPAGTPRGYTYLEEYLHFRAVPHATVPKSTAAQPSSFTTDLAKFTAGFKNSPTFSLANITGGTATLNGSNVTFHPATNTSGRAGFDLTVTDADSSSWTRQFALLVTNSSIPRNLLWTGGNASNAWDTTTANWRDPSSQPATFSDGDTALFDDRGNASQPVRINATRTTSAVTVTGTKDYTFSGAGTLASSGPLTKAGTTGLTLDVETNFAGGLFLNGGKTILTDGTDLGGGTLHFTGGSTLTSQHSASSTLDITPDIEVATGAVGNINLSPRVNLDGSLSGGGTFNIFSPSTLGTEGRVYLRGASAGCTGTVNLTGTGASKIAFRANGGAFNGFDNAHVHLGGIAVYTGNFSAGGTYALGALSGDSASSLAGPYLGGTTTWVVGDRGTDTTFAGAITDGPTAITHLRKTGDATLTLTGRNTYTGTTTVSGGTLAGSAALGSFLLVEHGTALSPGDSPGDPGTLTVADGIELLPATLHFDLSSNPATGNDRILNRAGTLTFRSPGANLGPHFEFNLIDGALGTGTYNLVSGGSNTSAPGSPRLTHNLPDNTRQSFNLQRSGGGSNDTYIRLVVSGTAADLTFTGTTSGWNVADTTPWTGGTGGDNRFYNLDRVTFDDTAATHAVFLSGELEPQSINVSTNSFRFGGGGSIVGNTLLVKSGSGRLFLDNDGANTYHGGTTVNAGSIQINTSTALGTGPVHLAGGTLELPNGATFLDNAFHVSGTSAITSAYIGNSTIANATSSALTSTPSATLDLAGVRGILSINAPMDDFSGTIRFGDGSGMLRLNANTSTTADVNQGSSTTHFHLGTAAATLTNRNGDQTIHLGALSGGSNTHLNGRQSGTGNTSTTYIVGALNTDTTFDGTIHHDGDNAGLHFVKIGTGTLTLGGRSNFRGSVDVRSGTLCISSLLACTASVTVRPGAHLKLANTTLAAESLHIEPGATLTGHGTLDTELVNDGTLTATAPLHITGPVVNTGLLDFLTSPLPADVTNNGIIITPNDLTITNITVTPTTVTITAPTFANHTYTLEHSPDATTWLPVTPPIPGDNTERPFTHTTNTPTGFYRLTIR